MKHRCAHDRAREPAQVRRLPCWREMPWPGRLPCGDALTGPDFGTVGPIFTVKVSAAGVFLDCTWQGFAQVLHAIEFLVERGDGQGAKCLVQDSTPGYNDTHPFPAAPAKWTYTAVFRVGDARVGQWSAPVSVNVG